MRAIVVVELSAGQLVEDVRLAVEGRAPVFLHGRTGGMVPTPGEVLEAVRRGVGRDRPTPQTSDIATASAAADEPDPLSLIELGAWAAAGHPGPEPRGDADLSAPPAPVHAGTGG